MNHKRLEEELKHFSNNNNLQQQAQMANQMLSAIREFANTYGEEVRLIKEAKGLKSQLIKNPKDDEERRQNRDLEETIRRAETAQRNIEYKKQTLRSLQQTLSVMKNEINKLVLTR